MQVVNQILRDPSLRSRDCFLEGDTLRMEEMTRTDLAEVLTIERSSFANPWSQACFEREMEKPYASLQVARLTVADNVNPVLGYICFWLVADEIQITNLAVHIGYRRLGVGKRLLLHALALGYSTGARLAVLEVRVSNKPARLLYEGYGFVAVQKRPRYYAESREDALVMRLHLSSCNTGYDKEPARPFL